MSSPKKTMKSRRVVNARISLWVLLLGGRLVESFAPHHQVKTRSYLKRVHVGTRYVSRSFYDGQREDKEGKARVPMTEKQTSLPATAPFTFLRQQDASPRVERENALENTLGMPDLISFLQPKPLSENSKGLAITSSPASTAGVDDSSSTAAALDVKTLLLGFSCIVATIVVVACSAFGLTPNDVIHGAETFVANPQESLQQILDLVKSTGSAGPLYFGILYFLAEILAIPATPLTLSAGFLFGTTNGVITVLIAATFAASFGFVVGKTVLRGTVENILKENPKYAKLDKAVGEKGFPLLLLVRLTPLFPFSLSNYVYGASSIKFPDYFWGTLLGFLPGTVAYVYTGEVGQALTTGGGSQPWYVYAGGLAVLAGVLKLVTDVATGIVSALDEEEEANAA